MKTKFRTLGAVAILVIIGATNINATADYKKVMNEETTVENEISLSVESWMIDEDLWAPKSTIETVENERTLEVESWMTNESLWK